MPLRALAILPPQGDDVRPVLLGDGNGFAQRQRRRRLGDVQAARHVESRRLPDPADRGPQLGLFRRQRGLAGADLALGIEHGKPDPLGLDRPRAAELDARHGNALDALEACQVFFGEFQHRLGFQHVVERGGRIGQPLPHLVAVVGVGHGHADLRHWPSPPHACRTGTSRWETWR